MMKADTLIIEVSDEMATRLRSAVASGDYSGPSEIIDEALRHWLDERNLPEPSVEKLRQAWDAGKTSGVYGHLDFDDLRQEARRRLATAQTTPRRDD